MRGLGRSLMISGGPPTIGEVGSISMIVQIGEFPRPCHPSMHWLWIGLRAIGARFTVQDFFAQEGDTGKLRNKKRDG
jgi:hypothetical protein